MALHLRRKVRRIHPPGAESQVQRGISSHSPRRLREAKTLDEKSDGGVFGRGALSFAWGAVLAHRAHRRSCSGRDTAVALLPGARSAASAPGTAGLRVRREGRLHEAAQRCLALQTERCHVT